MKIQAQYGCHEKDIADYTCYRINDALDINGDIRRIFFGRFQKMTPSGQEINLIHRKMKLLSKLICYLITFSFPCYAVAQQNVTSPVSLNKIGDKLYEITGGSGANGGAFIGDYGVLLIDAKMNQESVNQTIEEIRKLTDKPIRFMVNTHSDGDHVAGNRFFPESVVFVAHENCRKEFFHPGRNGEPSSWNDPKLAPYIPSVTFSNKMDLYVDAKKVELWYFGKGHTTGDIVVYFPDERIAFVGDQVFKGRVQLIHSYKGGNSFEHVKTLEKMLETLDAEKFYSGHSEAMDRNMILAHINGTKELQNKVAGYMNKNYSLENIKKEFSKDQGTLIETIFNEILAARCGISVQAEQTRNAFFTGLEKYSSLLTSA